MPLPHDGLWSLHPRQSRTEVEEMLYVGEKRKWRRRRYALLLAARDSEYVKKMRGGYYNVFVESLGEEGDIWDLFRVVDGEFPDLKELWMYDGFVVSGSPHDAYANEPWILKLCFLLQTLDAMHKKLLGVCFGHQVLCRAFGGKVGKASGGWDIGIRRLTMLEGSVLNNINLVDIPTSPSIIEIHQDEVFELPPGARLLAYSEKTNVEMFAMDDHVLGIQGHPEYSKDILYNLTDRLAFSNTIEVDYAEELKKKIEEAEPSEQFWRKVCKSFLTGSGNLLEFSHPTSSSEEEEEFDV